VSHLTAADLRAGIDNGQTDFLTIAEGFGIKDEEVVRQALSQFRIEPVDQPEGVKFRLRYRPARLRPVHLWLSTDPAQVRTEREEALEPFEGARVKGARRVRAHLRLVVEVAALELGWSQLEDMGVVLAGQVAEYLACVGDGLIRDQNDDWWAMEGRVPILLVGPARRG
jgi:hypothetical protein